MRFLYVLTGVLALFVSFTSNLYASSASIDALGQPLLVLEEEGTVSSIFNQGNPAGLVFIPNQTRLDFNISADYMTNRYKYNTYPRNITTTAVPHITPDGSTIVANAWFAQNSYLFSSRLNNIAHYQWSGIIFRPVDNLTVQLIPLSTFRRNANDEDVAASRFLNGGLNARSAIKLNTNLSLGAGISYSSGKEDGLEMGIYKTLFTDSLINQLLSSEILSAELGANCRNENVFDENDTLDIGILFKVNQSKTYGDLYFDSRLLSGIDNDPEVHSNNINLPWSVSLLNSYRYKSVMDIGFQLGYEEEKDYYNWSSDYYTDQNSFVYSTLDNIFYELTFRVRLPMVREDDLRFGVAFNNKGRGNQYQSGRIQIDLPNQSDSVATIHTSSSSIAIETGFVPYDGSIVSLKYHLGSSKSLQSDIIIDDYGYTEFSFGLKFKLLNWLALSSSYSNLRQATEGINYIFEQTGTGTSAEAIYDTVGYPVIKSEEINTLRLGIGITTKSWDLDLTTSAYHIANSPTGWQYRPTNTEIEEEEIAGYSSMLSFIYRY